MQLKPHQVNATSAIFIRVTLTLQQFWLSYTFVHYCSLEEIVRLLKDNKSLHTHTRKTHRRRSPVGRVSYWQIIMYKPTHTFQCAKHDLFCVFFSSYTIFSSPNMKGNVPYNVAFLHFAFRRLIIAAS